MPEILLPDWPAPASIHACTTLRQGGVSEPPYDSWNLAGHVGDDPEHVRQNRSLLRKYLQLPAEPSWLEQVHGTQVVDLAGAGGEAVADGSYTAQPGRVCVVLTADCLPVLICNSEGTEVSAAHAGWRGLAAGVIESALDCFQSPDSDLLVWLGPAIGPEAFEVGAEVRAAFVHDLPEAASAFRPRPENKWMADLYRLARLRLSRRGIERVYGGGYCTFQDSERFYSYRRAARTGRMASLIWIE